MKNFSSDKSNKYKIFGVLLIIACNSFAQTTSNTADPDWGANADWTGTAPGYNTNQSAILDHDSDISGNPLNYQ